VETHSGDGVKLQPTLRYAHGKDYLRATLGNAGLIPMQLDACAVRTEKGVPVEGLMAVAALAPSLHAGG
jgi:predicted TPR repeat methyltransferase